MIGPISRITRLTMPRAGRPVIRLVSAVPSSRAPCSAARCGGGDLRLRTAQVGAADLHAGGAERECRRDPARVADGAGRDHRHLHRIDHLRHQREGADLRRQIVGQEHAAMAARLAALRDDRIDAALLQPARLVDGGRRTDHDAAGRLDPLHQRVAPADRSGSSTTSGLHLLDHLAQRARRTARGCWSEPAPPDRSRVRDNTAASRSRQRASRALFGTGAT